MAKGLRASVNKANKKVLRSRVFGPVEEARLERLSAKLLETASQPKPEKAEMDVDEGSKEDAPAGAASQNGDKAEAMEVDGAPRPGTASSTKKSAGIRKKRRSKSTTTFASLDKRKAKMAAAKRKGGKR